MSTASEAATELADLSSWAAGPPHELFDRLRRDGSVAWIPNPWGTGDSEGYWAVVSHADVLSISRDDEHFTTTLGASYPVFDKPTETTQNVLMLTDPPRHTRLRKMAGSSFSPRVIARFDGWVRNVVQECLTHISTLEEFDVVEELAAIVPGKVIAEVLGAPPGEHGRIIQWANEVFGREDPDGGQERSVQAIESLVGYAFALREQKRVNPGVDVITELANASYEGEPITDGEFGAFVMLLLVAGFETTHTLIGQTVRLLLERPDVDAAARVAVASDKVHDLNEEFLRYITPAMNMARYARSDVELGGQHVRKGQMAVMIYAAANRDPTAFADPHRFDAARKGNIHLAFGGQGSPHYCLGHALGRLEGRIVLEELLRSDLRLELAGEPRLTGSVFINQLDSLPARVVR